MSMLRILKSSGNFANVRIFRWSFFSRLGSSRLLREVSRWFILAPILARIIGFIKEATLGDPRGASRMQSLDWIILPYDWQLLYFAAFSFFLATLIFQLRSPRIFIDYSDYYSYAKAEFSSGEIFDYFLEPADFDGSDNPTYRAATDLMNLADDPTAKQAIGSPKVDIETVDSAFNASTFNLNVRLAKRCTWRFCNRSRPLSRIICSLLFATGCCFVGLAFLSDLHAVVKQSLESDLLEHILEVFGAPASH